MFEVRETGNPEVPLYFGEGLRRSLGNAAGCGGEGQMGMLFPSSHMVATSLRAVSTSPDATASARCAIFVGSLAPNTSRTEL